MVNYQSVNKKYDLQTLRLYFKLSTALIRENKLTSNEIDFKVIVTTNIFVDKNSFVSLSFYHTIPTI